MLDPCDFLPTNEQMQLMINHAGIGEKVCFYQRLRRSGATYHSQSYARGRTRLSNILYLENESFFTVHVFGRSLVGQVFALGSRHICDNSGIADHIRKEIACINEVAAANTFKDYGIRLVKSDSVYLPDF